jgi:hypothetical protein
MKKQLEEKEGFHFNGHPFASVQCWGRERLALHGDIVACLRPIHVLTVSREILLSARRAKNMPPLGPKVDFRFLQSARFPPPQLLLSVPEFVPVLSPCCSLVIYILFTERYPLSCSKFFLKQVTEASAN